MKKIIHYLMVSFKTGVRESMVFRSNFLIGFLFVAVRAAMLLALWNALYSGKTEVSGIDLATMQFYTIASIIYEIIISAGVEKSMSSKVWDGSISMVLTRPMVYPVSLCMEQFALTLQNIIIRVVPYTLILVASGLLSRASVFFTAEFIASAALGYFLMLFYQMFFGMICFWTMDISGILNARDAAMLVFSGSMIPLWFFPDWLFSVAQYLPFQAIYSAPLSILIGKIRGDEVYAALLVQLAWLALFVFLALLFWSKARRRIVVNGG